MSDKHTPQPVSGKGRVGEVANVKKWCDQMWLAIIDEKRKIKLGNKAARRSS